ncbi:uncharacterized protein LOC124166944 [Ischnura elegans]|uniref:uncharacterized protein LOC124166944 n=1 Tax=Ischnura elegans TaxID=197161 RepID=UPI001ED88B19|nr:uncharacterized protein LOC124166944 [Ischnura elegans]
MDYRNAGIILPHHLRCASHTLNLLATTDLQNALKGSSVDRIHYPALAKCSTLWNASRRPKSSEVIQGILGYQLLYPCPTRWNSLYDSISQLMKHKDRLNKLFEKLNLSNTFKEVEIEYLEEFIVMMKPIATALDYLQGQKACYYGQLLPTLMSLRIRLQHLMENNLRHTAGIVTALVKSLHDRFELFFSLSPLVNEAILAACFHPSFKLRWLPDHISNCERKRIQNLCINSLESYISSICDDTCDTTSGGEEDDFLVLSNTSEKKQQSHIDLEVISYFNDKNKSLSSLQNYPNVKKMFIRFNTSLCSSSPVERLFSHAGFIHSPERGSLSDKLFEKLVFLKGNNSFIESNI